LQDIGSSGLFSSQAPTTASLHSGLYLNTAELKALAEGKEPKSKNLVVVQKKLVQEKPVVRENVMPKNSVEVDAKQLEQPVEGENVEIDAKHLEQAVEDASAASWDFQVIKLLGLLEIS